MRSGKLNIVLADLDGTLITRGRGDIDECRDFVEDLTRSGATLIPVSARPAQTIAQLFDGIDAVSLAVGSGGAVVARIGCGVVTDVLNEHLLDSNVVRHVTQVLSAVCPEDDGVLFRFSGSADEFSVVASQRGRPTVEIEELRSLTAPRPLRITGPMPLDGAISTLGVSLLSTATPERLRQDMATHLAEAGPWRAGIYPEYRLPGLTWVEIVSASANKGVGSRAALAAIGLSDTQPPPNIVALGDSTDDLAMFQQADLTLCPSDATPDVQTSASVAVDALSGTQFTQAIRQRLGI